MKKHIYKKSAAGIIAVTAISALLVGSLIHPVSAKAAVKNGWFTENGKQYWYENGVKQGTTGRGKEIYDPSSRAWYWLDSVQGGAKAVNKDCYLDSNGGKWVRYDSQGRMIKGEDYRYKGWYWFDQITGAMYKGFTFIPDRDNAGDGKWVYYDETTGQMHHGESCINGNWYYYDKVTGKMYKGFAYLPESNKWVFYDEITGIMYHGWANINGNQYFFDYATGEMAKGWITVDGQEYLFDVLTGVLKGTGDQYKKVYFSQLGSESKATIKNYCDQLVAGKMTSQQVESKIMSMNANAPVTNYEDGSYDTNQTRVVACKVQVINVNENKLLDNSYSIFQKYNNAGTEWCVVSKVKNSDGTYREAVINYVVSPVY